MSVQLATLDILVNDAHFDPHVARAIGAAIENEIVHARPVTESALDARLSVLGARLDSKFAVVEARFEGIDARFEGLEARFEGLEARVMAKMEGFRGDVALNLAQLENRLMLRMAGMGLAGITILFSLIKLTG